MFTFPVGIMRSPNTVNNPLDIVGCSSWFRSDLGVTVATGVSAWVNQALTLACTLKNSAASNWGSCGASSLATIAGDGWVEFTSNELSLDKICGLSHTDPDANYTSIDFAIYLDGTNNIKIYESGTQRTAGSPGGAGIYGTYALGDTMRVQVASSVVKYYQNGVLLYTSGVTPTFPLRVDTAIYATLATLSKVTLVDNGSIVATTWTNLIGIPNKNISQTTGANQPTYASSGGLNNQAKITFVSGKQFVWDNKVQAAQTMLVVLKLASTPGTGFTITAQVGYNTYGVYELIMDYLPGGYTPISFVANAGSPMRGHSIGLGSTVGHGFIWSFNGTGGAVDSSYYSTRLDGSSAALAVSGAYGSVNTVSSIGARDNGTFPFLGDLYEIAVWDRVLTADELDRLSTYVKGRYAL